MDMHDFHKKSSKARQKERQDAIIDYLVKNAHLHINKQMVIDAVTERGKGSRNTIMDDLNLLHQYGIIKISHDKGKENSQTHWVSINSDSEMLRIIENIQNIRDTFFELIEKANTLPKENEIDDKIDPHRYEDVNGAEIAIMTLFEHLVGIYMLYFLLEWPKKVPDIITRFELYTLTFQKIQEIQVRLLERFSHPEQITHDRGIIVKDLFVLKKSRLFLTVDRLKKVGFGEQAEPLLDELWKFSLPFANDGVLKLYGYSHSYQRKNRVKFQEAIRIASDWRKLTEEKYNPKPKTILEHILALARDD